MPVPVPLFCSRAALAALTPRPREARTGSCYNKQSTRFLRQRVCLASSLTSGGIPATRRPSMGSRPRPHVLPDPILVAHSNEETNTNITEAAEAVPPQRELFKPKRFDCSSPTEAWAARVSKRPDGDDPVDKDMMPTQLSAFVQMERRLVSCCYYRCC